MTRCSMHPEYDGFDRPQDACGHCSLQYVTAQSDRFLLLEWKTLKESSESQKRPVQPLRAMTAAAGFKAG